VVWSVTSSHCGRRRIVSLGRIRNAGLFQLAEASHISASLVPQSVKVPTFVAFSRDLQRVKISSRLDQLATLIALALSSIHNHGLLLMLQSVLAAPTVLRGSRVGLICILLPLEDDLLSRHRLEPTLLRCRILESVRLHVKLLLLILDLEMQLFLLSFKTVILLLKLTANVVKLLAFVLPKVILNRVFALESLHLHTHCVKLLESVEFSGSFLVHLPS